MIQPLQLLNQCLPQRSKLHSNCFTPMFEGVQLRKATKTIKFASSKVNAGVGLCCVNQSSPAHCSPTPDAAPEMSEQLTAFRTRGWETNQISTLLGNVTQRQR